MKLRNISCRMGWAALAGSVLAAAPAPAQVILNDPHIASGPIEPSDPLVGLAMPGATPAEYRAHLLWNLRAGLNVAALQCQFSPYLRTIDNYNGVLAGHSRELAAAYQTLESYFRRTGGGPRRFDDYSTQTYNGFSTFQAQYGFCQTASRIGKEALATRQGQLYQLAADRMRELRSSLTPAYETFSFTNAPIRLSPFTVTVDCSRYRGRDRRTCERGTAAR